MDQTNGTIPVSARPVKRKSVDELEPIGKRRQNGKAPIWEAETIPELADDDEAEDVYGDEDIDIPEEAAFDEATLPFRLQNHHLEAKGDGDVWTCPLEGCLHKVYAASEPASHMLIKEHYRMHSFDDDARVQLVRKMEAPWLPVGRLMERVQGLARKQGITPPIVQRY